MEAREDTFDIDTIRYYNDEYHARLLHNGVTPVGMVHVPDRTLHFDGPVTVVFDEYITTIEGDMKATVSWSEDTWDGEVVREDHVLEQVEVFE